MVTVKTRRQLLAGLFLICGAASITLFSISAAQVKNDQRDYSDEACTDVTKGMLLALYRPSRYILVSQKTGGNDDPYNVCSWHTMNSVIRMVPSALLFIIMFPAIWGTLTRRNWLIWLFVILSFITAALLLGTMVYDANDIQTSKSWCESGQDGAPHYVSCDYDPFVTTILIEVGLSFVLFFESYVGYRFLRVKTRLISAAEADEYGYNYDGTVASRSGSSI